MDTLTEQIIAAAIEVHRILGPGFQTGSNENPHFHSGGGTNPLVVNLFVAVKSRKCLYISKICKIMLDFRVCLC